MEDISALVISTVPEVMEISASFFFAMKKAKEFEYKFLRYKPQILKN